MKFNKKSLTVSVLSLIVMALALAPVANAQAPAQAPVPVYGGQGGVVTGQVAPSTTPPSPNPGNDRGGNNQGGGSAGEQDSGVAAEAQASNDVLPFTGLDLLLILGGGLGLVASGVLLSRLVARDPA